MKTFIIAFLFIAATILPILFIPLLVLTLIVILIVAPHTLKHGVWPEDHKLDSTFKH